MLGGLAMTANCDQMAEQAAEALRAGRLAEAEATLNSLLLEAPRHADGLQLMGVLRQKQGNIPGAEEYLKAAIAEAPNEWPAHVNLSGLYLRSGNAEAALIAAKEAAEIAPREPVIWRHLADAAERLAEFEEGSRALDQLSALGAADMRVELRGALHGILGARFGAARDALDRARSKGATPDQLRPIMAELAIAQGSWVELKSIAEAWQAEKPGLRKAQELAARAELELGNIEKAATLFRPLIENAEEVSSEDALIYGRICLNAQRLDDAEHYLSMAASAMPHHADTLTSLARLKTFMGDFKEARRLCEEAIEAEPENARPYLQLTVILRGRIEDRYLEAMLALRDGGIADPALAAGVEFALGDIAFRKGEGEQALACYRQGNEARRNQGYDRRYLYDRAMMESDIALLREASGRLAAMTPPEPPVAGPEPIFITGMPRSGTTLIERIIGAHPDVTPLGERTVGPALLEDFLMRARQEGAAGACEWAHMAREELQARYLGGTEAVETGFFTDKMPGNALAIPLFSMLFPKARFLLTIRRPFDVAVSIYRHQFPFAYSWAHRFEDIAHFFPAYMGTAAGFVRERPERAGFVRYDELVADPAEGIRRVIAMAGLDWDEACAHPQTQGRSIATFSSVQARAEISSKSSDGGGLFRPLLAKEAGFLDAAVMAAIGD